MDVVDGLVGGEIDLSYSEAPPQPFCEDIVPPAPSTIHTDLNPVSLQESRNLLAGELAALTHVEDLRRVIPADHLLQCVQAEGRRGRVGGSPSSGDWPTRRWHSNAPGRVASESE